MRTHALLGATALAFLALTGTSLAGNAHSEVDVGRRHADAQAGYSAPAGIAQTYSHVGAVSVGRGFAVGYGDGGISVSHSIGVSGPVAGTAHSFQLSVGPNGTHVGRSSVVTSGGNTRVIAGGETSSGPIRPQGSAFAGGFGRRTDAWSQSQVRAHHDAVRHLLRTR